MSAKVLSTTATPLSTAAQMAFAANPVPPSALPAVAAPVKATTVTASPLVGVSVTATQPELQISREAIEAMAEAPLASDGLSSGTYSSERTLTREEMIKEGRIIQAPQQTWSAPLVISSSFVEPEAPPGIAPESILEAAETSNSVGNCLREAEIFEPVVQVKEERAKGGFFGGFAAWVQGICKVAPKATAAPTGIPTDEMVEVQPLVEMAAPIATATGVTMEVCDEAAIAAAPGITTVVQDEAPIVAAPEVTPMAPIAAAPVVTMLAPIAAAPVVTTVVCNSATNPVASPSIVVAPTTNIAASSPAWILGEIYTIPEDCKKMDARTAAVCTPEQQDRLGVNEHGNKVVKTSDLALFRSVEKIVQVPQIQSVDTMLDTPRSMASSTPELQIQEVVKTVQVPQIQEVLKKVQVPQLQQVEKPTTDPQTQAVEKEVTVPIPLIQEEEVIVQAAPAVAVVPEGQEQVASP